MQYPTHAGKRTFIMIIIMRIIIIIRVAKVRYSSAAIAYCLPAFGYSTTSSTYLVHAAGVIIRR